MELRGGLEGLYEPPPSLTDEECARLALVVCRLMESGMYLVNSADTVLRMAQPHSFLIPLRQCRDEFVKVYNDTMRDLDLIRTKATGGAFRAGQDTNGGEPAAPAPGE